VPNPLEKAQAHASLDKGGLTRLRKMAGGVPSPKTASSIHESGWSDSKKQKRPAVHSKKYRGENTIGHRLGMGNSPGKAGQTIEPVVTG